MQFAHRVALAIALSALSVGTVRAATEGQSRGYFGLSSKKILPSKRTESKPTVITKMTNSTKRLVSNTTNKLTPKKNAATKKSGTTAVYPKQTNKDEKQGFFKSMFNPEPPPPPKTVKEWMQLKQIHP